MEDFSHQLDQLRRSAQQLENVELNNFIDETEQIGRQLKSSQDFLLRDIQRLKQDLDANYTRLDYATELRVIDQKTLETFHTKLEELTRILADVKTKELNTWHLVQILRVNTSRLWHIFETATGTTITEELIYEDVQKLLNLAQIDKDEQTISLTRLEQEHGGLLVKLKEIQLSLEQFRTTIIHLTQNTNELKLKIKTQQQINDRTHEQSTKRINHLVFNTKDVQRLLVQYQSIVNEIHHILKLVFHVQTQIELHHKTILIYQTKLEKYKQDLTLIMLNRSNYEDQIAYLQKRIEQQNGNFKQLEYQEIQIKQHRQELHQQIDILEKEKSQILNHQQQLLDTIKQTIAKNHVLEKEVWHSNHAIKDLQYSHRQLTKDHRKQQEISNSLQKTIETNEQRLQITKVEINQLTEQVAQQNQLINSKENQIEFHIKGSLDLENHLSTIQEELTNQQIKVDESKTQVKLLTQKMHRLTTDEKPLMQEIAHYQKQLVQYEMNHSQLEANLNQNETNISQYRTVIFKLTGECKQNEHVLVQENLLLQQCQSKQERTKEDINELNDKLKHSECDYQNLKEIFNYTENENRQLEQQYEKLTSVVQLLGHRQAVVNRDLQPLYQEVKRLTNQHHDQVKMVEQSKLDLAILRKYYGHLQTYQHQLQQALQFKSQEHNEYLHSQPLSNQFFNVQNQRQLNMKINPNRIHHWHTLKISSPNEFEKLSKLFLIKNKLVKKSNELSHLQQIVHEKHTLYHHVNHIYLRRDRLSQKINACNVLREQLAKQKKLRNELKSNMDDTESVEYKNSIRNLFRK